MIKDEDWTILPGDRALKQAVDRTIKNQKIKDARAVDYQNHLLEKSYEFIKNYDLAIDAGANYGIFSYHLNKKFKEVHAFEVATDVRNCLIKNVANFKMKNVKIHECGLGDVEKFVSLQYIKNSFGTYVDPSQSGGDFLIKSIDSFNFQACGFIKIDCEGYEPYIVKGAEQTIKKFRPVILVEDKNLSNKYYGLEHRQHIKILESWGYKIVHQWTKDCLLA